MEDGDPVIVPAGLGDIERAIGMTQIAKETGLSRVSLYRTLSADGHPEFATVANVMEGTRFKAVPDR